MAVSGAARLAELDRLTSGRSGLHALDARFKILLGLAFSFAVVSLPKYAFLRLLPLTLFPLAAAAWGALPPARLLKKALPAAGVALALGAFNPFFDASPLHFNGLALSGGWVSLAGLLLRAVLVAFMALLLIAATGFSALCDALAGLGAPRLFTEQLRLLWRYADLLAEEGARLSRARDLRDPLRRSRGPRIAGHLIAALLGRSLQRAERIHDAMLCRGYAGALHRPSPRRPCAREWAVLALGLALVAALRFAPFPDFVAGALP